MSTQPPWIQTVSGRAVTPLSPKPEQINIRDIAHALSMICRFTGHTRTFYSVAEHSVRVAMYLRMTGGRHAEELAQWGLLHDGSEAYLTDISSPLKRTEGFAAYREIEARMQAAVFERFGLWHPEQLQRPLGDEADLKLLSTERYNLLGPTPDGWAWGNLPKPLSVEGDELGWPPCEAEARFLSLFRTLFFFYDRGES